MTTEFDPNTYVSKTVHGGVREIVGEEAEKIRARLEMMTFKCPLKNPNCKENCGSYGCGN